ncbi:MAG: hypothetical protein HOV80_24670 [Polyangiaceae bacterium]|nr:hypothetical protein [Polyangiaceae bacterium]
MADDDDDLGGGTLVMSPEERPPITGAAPKAVPPPPTAAPADPQTTEDSWDSDAPGTFIMNPTDHTAAPTPASPFADANKRDSWPLAQVVVGSAPKQPGFAHAQTLMGGMQVMEEAEAIMAEREQQMQQQQLQQQQQQQQQPMLQQQPQMPPPAQDRMMGFPSQPQLPQHSPMQGLAPNEPFPTPGFYGRDSTMEPQQKPGLGPLLLGAGVGLLTVTIVVGGYYGYRALSGSSAAPTATAVASTSATPPPAGGSAVPVPAPATAQTSAPTAKPQASTAPALPPANAGSAEAEARAALEKLGAGIKSCVATTIGKLPGTAPAVPSSLTWLKSGSYKPSLNDFESPVYHCARFKIEQPMRFAIQWQSDDVKGTKGSAIAWIDDNGDGVADRAFGFNATLPKRKVAEIGPIEAVDAKRAIKKR